MTICETPLFLVHKKCEVEINFTFLVKLNYWSWRYLLHDLWSWCEIGEVKQSQTCLKYDITILFINVCKNWVIDRWNIIKLPFLHLTNSREGKIEKIITKKVIKHSSSYNKCTKKQCFLSYQAYCFGEIVLKWDVNCFMDSFIDKKWSILPFSIKLVRLGFIGWLIFGEFF
jgi:hypothetical protein